MFVCYLFLKRGCEDNIMRSVTANSRKSTKVTTETQIVQTKYKNNEEAVVLHLSTKRT